MDRFDALILTALQRNARLTAEALSMRVGLSPDACRKRLARLRGSGVIEAEIAVLDPARAGRGLTLIVEVTLQNERTADLDRFKARMRDAPEVMQCYYVTGNADFVLILSARDMADYDLCYKRLIEGVELETVTSFFAMEAIEEQRPIPLRPIG